MGGTCYIDDDYRDVDGGLATISNVSNSISAGDPTWFVEFHGLNSSYNYPMLLEQQYKLMIEYGHKRAMMSCDVIPNHARHQESYADGFKLGAEDHVLKHRPKYIARSVMEMAQENHILGKPYVVNVYKNSAGEKDKPVELKQSDNMIHYAIGYINGWNLIY